MENTLVVCRVKDSWTSVVGCPYSDQQAARLREAVLHPLPRAIAGAAIERRLRALWIVRLIRTMRGRDDERRGICGICRHAPEVVMREPFVRSIPGLTTIFALEKAITGASETVAGR